MWTKFRKIILILIVASLVFPTSALDMISSVFAEESVNTSIETQDSDVIFSLLQSSTEFQETDVTTEDAETVTEEIEIPVEGEETPVKGEETPVEGEETPVEGEETPVEGEETPVEGEETPVEGEETPAEGEETPVEGEETPVEGEETPVEGEETPVEGEEVILEEDEVNPLNFTVDPNVTFSPNIRLLSQYAVRGTEVTNKLYEYKTYMANVIADLNTVESQNPFLGGTNTGNNGRVWVDKSVTIDSNFNYSTFDTISNGEFNVILSALGQEFEVNQNKPVAADVVFVLDVSGSMQSMVSGSNITRAQASVNAINTAITKLMESNSETRVAVVTFSGPSTATSGISANNYSKVLLPLASYSANNQDKNDGYPYLKYSTSRKGDNKTYTVSKATNLSVSGAEISSVNFDGGTYTQAGLQKGSKLLVNSSNPGERLPALILVSDGRPTYGASSYTNVGTSQYGNGVEKEDSDAGKMGYYTILTAQYQKSQIASHYSKTPLIYTLGLGITDQFGKTVLNPTQANVKLLDDNKDSQEELKSLLNKTSDNPFNKTSYANYSESGNMTAEQINSLLANMVENIATTANLPFESKGKETAITFTDVIGEGMEIKGDIIYVRYANETYTFTKQNDGTYKSDTEIAVTDDRHNSVILNNVSIQVTTDSKGVQTIIWKIPAELVPMYTTYDKYDLTAPIQLVYTVGLKEGAVTGVDYYTNGFTQNGETVTPLTTATFTLATNNPYKDKFVSTSNKDANNTNTANHSTVTSLNNNTVTATLGNNGKITLSDVKTDVTVKKEWDDFDNKHQTRPTSIQVQLKQNDKNYGDSVTLTANSWSHTWSELPMYDNDGKSYTYTVIELTKLDDYISTVDGLTITNSLIKTVDKTVTKQWEDNDNISGLRPTSIQVQLKRNDEIYGDVVTLNATDHWRYTWTNLEKYDSNGELYRYTVAEISEVPNYTTSYSDDTFTITNTLVEKGTVKIIKTDKVGAILSDVKFLLEQYVENQWMVVDTLTTSSEGIVTKENLPLGRYRLTELETQSGNSLLTSAIEFDLPYDSETVSHPKGVTIEASLDDYKMPVITLNIVNQKNGILENLPSTGGNGTMTYILGGSLLAGVTLSIYIGAIKYERKPKYKK